MKRISRILFLVCLFLASPALFYFGSLFLVHGCNPYFLHMDSCLDAGGRWDYEDQEYTFKQNEHEHEQAHEKEKENCKNPQPMMKITIQTINKPYATTGITSRWYSPQAALLP